MVAEHNNEVLNPVTLNTIAAAKKIGGDVTVLVAGTKCGPVSLHNHTIDIDFVCVYYMCVRSFVIGLGSCC